MKRMISLRIEKSLLEELKQKAKEDNRTMTNYIETVIQKHLIESRGK